jgi:MFS family permease
MSGPIPVDAHAGPRGKLPAAAVVGLAILTLINLLNYLDRYVVAGILTEIETAFAIDQTHAGLVQTMFLVSYVIASPFAGYFGDRIPRKYMIAAGVMVWSLATIASGMATTYSQLLIARAFIGVGEAGYATVAPSLISDLFPRGWRGKMMSVFYAAIPIGGALGFIVGGAVAARWGWRSAFFVAGGPGLFLAVLALFMKEPQRGATEETVGEAAPPMWEGVKQLLRNGQFQSINVGYTLLTFAIGGLALFMPTFFIKVHGVPLERADFVFGLITVTAGFAGTAAGGLAGDWALKRHAGGYLWISGMGLLLGTPFALATAFAPGVSTGYVMAGLAMFFLFFNTGPINAALVNCVPAQLRALAVAFDILCIHLFGDALSPILIGKVADAFDLRIAVAANAVPIVLGGVVLLVGARRVLPAPLPASST